MKWGLVLVMCLATAGFAAAQDQDQATAPTPPADQSQTIDQSAPTLQQAPPESQVRAVRLSAVVGAVKVLEGGNVAFQQAELNMPLVQGMKLVTGQGGRAEVQFEDGGVARLTPNSSITLTALSRDDSGVTVTGIEADSGLTYYELDGHSGQYAVQFGQRKIVSLDGGIFRLDLDHPQVVLAVMHGSVHVSDDENLAMDVHTDQSVEFDPQNADEYQLAQSVTANSWDQWNSDRDEALAELDNSETQAQADSSEPNNPAWSDLNANGDWYNVPGYGMGWSPSGVGQDWDPYGLGAWGYYSGVGYT
ncbi:MAG: FecR domain-containing protein, partial [Acidobacteriaceae bacterium]